MEAKDRQRMIRLLKLQIEDLHLRYSHLINETGKFSELKDTRVILKDLEKQLQSLENKV